MTDYHFAAFRFRQKIEKTKQNKTKQNITKTRTKKKTKEKKNKKGLFNEICFIIGDYDYICIA